jgi:hypothetical protein
MLANRHDPDLNRDIIRLCRVAQGHSLACNDALVELLSVRPSGVFRHLGRVYGFDWFALCGRMLVVMV